MPNPDPAQGAIDRGLVQNPAAPAAPVLSDPLKQAPVVKGGKMPKLRQPPPTAAQKAGRRWTDIRAQELEHGAMGWKRRQTLPYVNLAGIPHLG